MNKKVMKSQPISPGSATEVYRGRDMKNDLFDLSAEIIGVSAIISGLSNQLDNKTEVLTESVMHDALFGVARHLDRIAHDLGKLEETAV